MAKREGRWDCPFCRQTGILGRYKECPQCGRDRGKVKFYLPENEPVITSPELLDLADAGPDWVCRHCDASNRGDHQICKDCGADRGSSPELPIIEQYHQTGKPADLGSLLLPPSNRSKRKMRPVSTSPASVYPEKPKRFPISETYTGSTISMSRSLVIVALVVLLVGIIISGLILLSQPYEVTATIDRFEWHRTIFIDQYRTVEDGAWSVPAGGRLKRTESRIHHYDKVFDGYDYRTERYQCGSESYSCGTRDLGNGFFEDIECSRPVYCDRQVQEARYRDVPVYQDWYIFDIDRWIPSRNVPTSGTNRDDPAPYWGEFTLACANQAVIGCERETYRTQEYLVFFVWYEDELPKYFAQVEDQVDWDSYDTEQEYSLVLNGFGQLLNDPLRPEETDS